MLTFQSSLQALKDFPRPFWLVFFLEGTRLTQKKLFAAQEYAASTKIHVPKNVLVPRTKVRASLAVVVKEVHTC